MSLDQHNTYRIYLLNDSFDFNKNQIIDISGDLILSKFKKTNLIAKYTVNKKSYLNINQKIIDNKKTTYV